MMVIIIITALVGFRFCLAVNHVARTLIAFAPSTQGQSGSAGKPILSTPFIIFLNSSGDCSLSLPRSAVELQVKAFHYELVNIIHTPIPQINIQRAKSKRRQQLRAFFRVEQINSFCMRYP